MQKSIYIYVPCKEIFVVYRRNNDWDKSGINEKMKMKRGDDHNLVFAIFIWRINFQTSRKLWVVLFEFIPARPYELIFEEYSIQTLNISSSISAEENTRLVRSSIRINKLKFYQILNERKKWLEKFPTILDRWRLWSCRSTSTVQAQEGRICLVKFG